MDFENINIWCWVILAVACLICGIIGYYWGKGSGPSEDHLTELRVLRDKNVHLQASLDACNKVLAANTSKPKATPEPKAASPSSKSASSDAFDAKAAKAAFGKRVKQDDLKIVEGIGPKIEGLFHNFDIKTWKDLADVSVAKCQEVLDSGGSRYRIHDPASWPMQGKMAYKGQWKKLVKWQDDHKAGKF